MQYLIAILFNYVYVIYLYQIGYQSNSFISCTV